MPRTRRSPALRIPALRPLSQSLAVRLLPVDRATRRPARGRSRARLPGSLAASLLLALAALLPPGSGWGASTVDSAAPAPREVRFAIIGDRTGSAQPGVYESILEEIALFGPEFVVSVGDQIEGYTEDAASLEQQWGHITSLVATLPAPFHWCAGNHDITSDGMVEAYRRATGVQPCSSFDHDGIHFVLLDTGRWESTGEWMEKSGYVAWLEDDLRSHRDARLTIVVYHKPYWFDTLAEGKPDPLHQLFLEYGVDAVFNGHFHVYGHALYDGIPYTMVGSSGGATDAVDRNRGTFYHWLWCVARGDSLQWRVMAHEGILAPDAVTVSDLKFFNRLAREGIVAPAIVDPGPGQAAAGTLDLQNLLSTDWQSRLRWETPPGWTVTPASADIALPPGGRFSAPFEVRREGPVYPLPVARVEIPYREGRSTSHATPLNLRRIQSATAVSAAPAIDGRLDDGCWSRAVPAVEYGSAEGGTCAIEPTEIRFAYDAGGLYLAARCVQVRAPLTVAAHARDEAVHRDDCVGFFLCPRPDGGPVFQIYFNPEGVIFDQRIVAEGEGAGTDAAWNGQVAAVARTAEGEWTLEAAIPFGSLETAPPAPGETWRVNFRRKEIALGGSADWQVPIGYDPATCGSLRFD